MKWIFAILTVLAVLGAGAVAAADEDGCWPGYHFDTRLNMCVEDQTHVGEIQVRGEWLPQIAPCTGRYGYKVVDTGGVRRRYCVSELDSFEVTSGDVGRADSRDRDSVQYERRDERRTMNGSSVN